MTFLKILVLASSTLAVAAQAGVVIETVERDTKSGRETGTQTMMVQDGAARIEHSAGGDPENLIIFKDDVLYAIDTRKKSYTAIDRETAAALAGKMNDAMAEMRAQMAGMPPEQRAMMEQMMGKMGRPMPGAAAPKPVLAARDTGRSDKVEGRSCRIWEMTRDGQVDEELCVVPFSEVPGKEDLMAMSQKMASLMKEFTEAMGSFGPSGDDFETISSVKGYPVRVRHYRAGKPTGEETVLKDWRAETVEPKMFQVPSGYKKQDLMAEMQRNR